MITTAGIETGAGEGTTGEGSGRRAYEAKLVDRFREGDGRAFAEIVLRHHSAIFCLAHALSGEVELAEELTRLTFVRAQRRLRRFRQETPLALWLYRQAFKLARRRTRRVYAKMERLQELLGLGAEEVASLLREKPDAEEAVS